MVEASIWGVRGSFPLQKENYCRYGGHTSCISLAYKERMLVLDAGSGMHSLSEWLKEQEYEGKKLPRQIDIFLSHFHIDHLLGLFEFSPLYEKGREIHIYGKATGDSSLEETLNCLVGPPYWPLPLSGFGANITFHDLEASTELDLGDGIQINTYPTNHPGGGVLYRLAMDGKVIVYGLDLEVTKENWDDVVKVFWHADFGFFDAAILPEERAKYVGWGHSDWKENLLVAEQADVKQPMMMHYSKDHTDEILEQQEMSAHSENGNVVFTKEGMKVWMK